MQGCLFDLRIHRPATFEAIVLPERELLLHQVQLMIRRAITPIANVPFFVPSPLACLQITDTARRASAVAMLITR